MPRWDEPRFALSEGIGLEMRRFRRGPAADSTVRRREGARIKEIGRV